MLHGSYIVYVLSNLFVLICLDLTSNSTTKSVAFTDNSPAESYMPQPIMAVTDNSPSESYMPQPIKLPTGLNKFYLTYITALMFY